MVVWKSLSAEDEGVMPKLLTKSNYPRSKVLQEYILLSH